MRNALGFLIVSFALAGCLEQGKQAVADNGSINRGVVTSTSAAPPKQPPPDSDRYQGGGG